MGRVGGGRGGGERDYFGFFRGKKAERVPSVRGMMKDIFKLDETLLL